MKKKNYEHLKTEWDNHQKVMNQFVPFEKMIFQIDYCNGENKTNYVAQKKAAKAALDAEKKEKAEELAKELAKEGDNKAKQAEAAAIEKDHEERLKKRVEFLLKRMDQMNFIYRLVGAEALVDNWLVVKPKLERVKRSMETLDKAKADRLGADIQKRDDAITSLAEYDLELNDTDAGMKIIENPFWKDATAKVAIPV
jgi:hypothetical protein